MHSKKKKKKHRKKIVYYCYYLDARLIWLFLKIFWPLEDPEEGGLKPCSPYCRARALVCGCCLLRSRSLHPVPPHSLLLSSAQIQILSAPFHCNSTNFTLKGFQHKPPPYRLLSAHSVTHHNDTSTCCKLRYFSAKGTLTLSVAGWLGFRI